MRRVLEAIVSHPEGIDPATLAEIQRYTKLFWINTGPYNNLTARKFVLKTHAAGVSRPRRRRPRAAGASFPTQANESVDQLLTRLGPMFFDPERRPERDQQDAGARQRHPERQRQQPVLRREHGRPARLHREVRAQLPAGEDQRTTRRGGVPRRRTLRQGDPPDHRASRGGHPLRDRADGQRPARAHPVVPDRRDCRSSEIRHRLGGGQGVARRHDQRVHRGLHGSARHQGIVGSAGVLREQGEDRAHPEVRRQRAVVRGPDAVRRRSTARPTSRGSSPTRSTW